jgi:hypothetical protein
MVSGFLFSVCASTLIEKKLKAKNGMLNFFFISIMTQVGSDLVASVCY